MSSLVLTVVGARPQFIKAAVVSRALRTSALREELIHTGQHYDADMSAVFFTELEIPPPALDLGVGSGPHGEQTGRMLAALEAAMISRRPALVLVYGDTNSTAAAALAAAKLSIPVAHVEAGLRSFNRSMPEEVNRVVADHLSDILFPPTRGAVENLVREGLGDRGVDLVGDVMYDAVLHAAARPGKDRLLAQLGLTQGRYLLATIHRAENTDERSRLATIVGTLGRMAARVPVVFPVHPRTRGALERYGIELPSVAGFLPIAPASYLEMQALEAGARVIVTDSGGVQKEAFWHGVPCVTVRAETEWIELLADGWNRLADALDEAALTGAIEGAMDHPGGERPAYYGDGHAGDRIARRLEDWVASR